QRLAGDLDFETFAGRAFCGDIGLLRQPAPRRRDDDVRLRQIVLLDAEQCDRGLQPFAEERALEPDLISLAVERIELDEIAVHFTLRLEYLGEARIEPVVRRDV